MGGSEEGLRGREGGRQAEREGVEGGRGGKERESEVVQSLAAARDVNRRD